MSAGGPEAVPPAPERALMLVLALATVAYFAVPFVMTDGRDDGHLAFFDDDLFYYLQIARRAAGGQFSTFDGMTTTNGYHPLWMAVLSGMTMALGQGRAFFATLLALTGLLTLFASVRLWRLHLALGTPRPIALACVLLFHLVQMFLARPGMEIALTVPLALVLLDRSRGILRDPGAAALARHGALAGLLVLSRLDAAIFVAIHGALLAWALWRAGSLGAIRRWLPALLCGAAAGGLVLAPYLVANLLLFDGWLPISGQAKQLKEGIFLSTHGLRTLIRRCGMFCLVMPSGASILAAAACLHLHRLLPRRTVPRDEAVIAGTVVWFPPAFFATQALLSDWTFWNWYFYPLALGMGFYPWLLGEQAALLGLGRRVPALGRHADVARRGIAGVTALACGALLAGTIVRSSANKNGIYVAAKELVHFAQSHPGTYGMGDRAGITAYLLPHPLVQLEGLVGDRRLVELIRARAPLRDAFHLFGIDYYVSTRGWIEGGCYDAAEPKELQAGPHSPRMTARLCQAPLLQFNDGVVQTFVFDVRPPQARR